MCSASVEPSPSTISTPNRSRNRLNTWAGNGSPADTAIRTVANAAAGTSDDSSAP